MTFSLSHVCFFVSLLLLCSLFLYSPFLLSLSLALFFFFFLLSKFHPLELNPHSPFCFFLARFYPFTPYIYIQRQEFSFYEGLAFQVLCLISQVLLKVYARCLNTSLCNYYCYFFLPYIYGYVCFSYLKPLLKSRVIDMSSSLFS